MFYTVVYVAIVVIANAKNIDTHQLTIREVHYHNNKYYKEKIEIVS
jgi:ABC-type phosphate transport system substrate-binding protein